MHKERFMRKLLLIGFKDLKLIFRDRPALIFMLLAPFLLTVGMGVVTGRFSGSSNGLSDIPVVIVNLDREQLGNALVAVFSSQELASLVEPTASPDPEAARRLIDEDKAAAAIIIPEGFTRSIIPAAGTTFDSSYVQPQPVRIEVYANPARPTSAGVIKAIVDEFLARIEAGRTTGMVSILGLMQAGLIDPQNTEGEARKLFESVDQPEATAIMLKKNQEGAAAVDFDILAYMAPAMALLFLMYTVSQGGRSILLERAQGTLPRMLVSPTSSTQVLGGKVVGIFFTGVAQVGILILATALFFGVRWGDPAGVIVLDSGDGIRCSRLGDVDHRHGAHACTDLQHWLGNDVDLRHPGRQFYQSRTDAPVRANAEQTDSQRLGIGRFHNTCPGRDFARPWGTDSRRC